MNTDEFNEGDKVLYVPHHAAGNKSHPDCEHGIVSSKKEVNVFVKYFTKDGGLKLHAQATSPDDLVKP